MYGGMPPSRPCGAAEAASGLCSGRWRPLKVEILGRRQQQRNVCEVSKETGRFALVLSHWCLGTVFSFIWVLRCHKPAKWNFLIGLADIAAPKLSPVFQGARQVDEARRVIWNTFELFICFTFVQTLISGAGCYVRAIMEDNNPNQYKGLPKLLFSD